LISLIEGNLTAVALDRLDMIQKYRALLLVAGALSNISNYL
jgi:hypothetical protein